MQNAKRNSRTVIITVVLSILLGTIVLWDWIFTSSVPKGKFDIDCSSGHLLVDSIILFDSGSSRTLSNRKNIGVFLGKTMSIDLYGSKKVKNLFFVFRYPLFTFPIKFFSCASMEESHIESTVELLMGMNIIQRANWHFSFKDNYLEVMKRSEMVDIPMCAICWQYRNRLIPQIDMTLEGYKVDGILIDMGCNIDFCLKKNDVERMESLSGIRGKYYNKNTVWSSKNVYCLQLDSFKVGNKIYPNVYIDEVPRNLVGLGFMRRFDHLFWDSKHKKVYLWND